MLVTALGVYLSDPGPIIYMAKRCGKNGRSFMVYKFRSMRIPRKGAVESRITSKNDRRVFRFGKLIRLLKLDELPQLFNILFGDMSVIGPRPEDQSIVDEHYTPLLRETLAVSPGLASPGSIFNYTHLEAVLKDQSNPEEIYLKEVMPIKVKLDVVYCRNQNILYDIELILRTIYVIVARVLGKKDFPYPREYRKALNLKE